MSPLSKLKTQWGAKSRYFRVKSGMELAFYHPMTLFKSTLLPLLLLFFSLPTLSVAGNSCADVYTKDSSPETARLEQQARSLIQEYKAQFLVPENRSTRIRYTQGKKSVDGLTNVLRKINSNPYPFVYLRMGYVQQIRRWVKTNEWDSHHNVEHMIKRYKDYPMNRRLLIERTAFIRTEFEYLNSLLSLPDTRFPISVEIPQAINRSLLTEKRVLNSKSDVRREIAVLKANESDRFNAGLSRNFSNGAFFTGREREQAHLEQILRIAYRELKKFPLALRDAQKRANLISELEKILADAELQAPSPARYIETRRQFNAELLFFTGKRDFDPKGSDANDKILLNDRTDLGIDSEVVGPVSRLGRLVVATVPLQAIGALVLSLTPIVHQEIKQTLFREAYMQEIAKQEDTKFEESAYVFLKNQDGATFKDGKWVLNAKVQEDLTHLREMHKEFKEDAKKEQESVASFQKLLEGTDKP